MRYQEKNTLRKEINKLRIWHESLIPKLCQKHLCAMWFEGLGAYKIITEDKKAYRQHPAVKEFENNTSQLWNRLFDLRVEMLKRRYKPKEMPNIVIFDPNEPKYTLWQTLEQQIAVLKGKNCKCKLDSIGGEE